MLDPVKLSKEISEKGFGPFVGVPCSMLASLIAAIENNPYLDYYAATSEGEAMGMAAGFSLKKHIPVVLMQNSGLGNTVNPITSLHLIYKLPALLLISLRGGIGYRDAPEHEVMGKITGKVLDAIGVKYEYLAVSKDAVSEQLSRIYDYIHKKDLPYALITKKDTISGSFAKKFSPVSSGLSRKEAVKSILSALTGNEVIVSTTGFISRELYSENKSAKGIFYMLGSMGHAASIGLGIALLNKDRKIIVLDGDGALLMKMGSMATVGNYSPDNFTHILLDNASYESTGGQACVSVTVNFHLVAKNVGYKTAVLVENKGHLAESIKKTLSVHGPHFIHVKISSASREAVARVKLEPQKIKQDVKEFLKNG